ncbi:DUF305 domain-containing protein [Pedobacter sp. Du54]|uniref:DUF305 domain-containing protein n=1 Tax=Pedobacter anseongensis TaxID=3133439 RepID=UPI0030AA0A7E
MKMPYAMFALTLMISFFIMYSVMFLNVDDVGHVYLSLTRLYMSILMIAPMAILMLLMMPSMYSNKKLNRIIMGSGIVIFVVALVFLRSQAFISDRQYMKAMIPHHSSAILTSKRANITDKNVRKLADSIIVSQQEEIRRMKFLLDTLEGKFN